MTDKQIIFKCDVDCIRKNTEECFELDCIKGQESILKQLKAKEQECERLKNFHINLVGVKECEIRELVKLKAENEKLDTENKRLVAELANPVFDSFEELDKLKQALAEVRDIAEKARTDLFTCESIIYTDDDLREILQKISEVLDE